MPRQGQRAYKVVVAQPAIYAVVSPTGGVVEKRRLKKDAVALKNVYNEQTKIDKVFDKAMKPVKYTKKGVPYKIRKTGVKRKKANTKIFNAITDRDL